jgi:branched-chain amino acid transport system permease protein
VTFFIAVLFGLLQGAIYMAVALGLVLVFGVTDIVNFTHGQLVTFGALGLVVLAPDVGVLPAMLVTVAAVGAISAALYAGAFRFTLGNHMQGLVVSLGLLLILQNLTVQEFGGETREGPTLSGFVDLPGDQRVATIRLVVLAAMLAIALVFYLLMARTWIGRALRMCGSDQFAAATLGLSAKRVGFYAFVVSGALAAIAGIAIAVLAPVDPLTGAGYLLKAFAVVIIGGLGSMGGAAVAAFTFGVLESLGSRYIDPSLTNVYAYAFIIVVLLAAPSGLFNRAAGRAG